MEMILGMDSYHGLLPKIARQGPTGWHDAGNTGSALPGLAISVTTPKQARRIRVGIKEFSPNTYLPGD
jgi:hypothetical protein